MNTEWKTIMRFPSGIVTAPPSKSMLHRAAICAALAGNPIVGSGDYADDVGATIHGMDLLMRGASSKIDCGESGTTLRFLIPVALAKATPAVFTGRGRLLSRPMTPFLDELRAHGAQIGVTETAITVNGHIEAGVYRLPADVSSQYISGLLLALPLLSGNSTIELPAVPASAPYVDLTLAAMQHYGVLAGRIGNNTFTVSGRQIYQPAAMPIEGDYSGAAFFLVSGALGRPVSVAGLSPDSKQGDRRILNILEQCGIHLSSENGVIAALPGEIAAVDIDMTNIPDLAPPIAALLCFAQGESRLYGVSRLRYKESDRLRSITTGLRSLGAYITATGDEILIRGKSALHGGKVDSSGDHRIAMMAAVAAIRCDSPVSVSDPGCVSKSCPNFWQMFEVSE
jgi:3-phosphoshikimate 1-carboxyvinyltransferase